MGGKTGARCTVRMRSRKSGTRSVQAASQRDKRTRMSIDTTVVRRRGAQVAYLAALLLGATMVWLAPRPPMEDFPQHVAQVTLLRDLLRGTSPWSDLLRINWFTPYLLGYGATLLLSSAMP